MGVCRALDSGVVQSGYTFAQPITLTLTYKDSAVAGLDEEAQSLYHWSETGQAWSHSMNPTGPIGPRSVGAFACAVDLVMK